MKLPTKAQKNKIRELNRKFNLLPCDSTAKKLFKLLYICGSPQVGSKEFEKWIQDNNLRVVTWQEGASHVLMPSQATRKAMKDQLMGAGELLRSNALHAEELFSADEDLREGNLFEDLA